MSLFQRSTRNIYRLRQRVLHNAGMVPSLRFAMLSHPGRVRKGNEDTCAAAAELGAFVVCDGMGGAAAGEVASALATQVFLETLRAQPDPASATRTEEKRLETAVSLANRAVYRQASSSPQLQGMGTTLVGILYTRPEGSTAASLSLVHVGDSRCYRWRNETLHPLTLDHSLVEEQLRLGEITPREAETHPLRNIITRAVGAAPTVEPEIQRLAPQPGDVYLLASDGLTRELSEPALATTFRQATTPRSRSQKIDLATLARTLIDQANDAGGRDNITVLLLHLP